MSATTEHTSIPGKHCPFTVRCLIFPEFEKKERLYGSFRVSIVQSVYCEGNFRTCDYKRANNGVMPPPNRLPDGPSIENR